MMPTEHDHYLKAVEATDPLMALQSCEAITSDSLQGECVLFAAKAAVEKRLDGLKFCESAPNNAWRSACLFEVADVSGATGQRADSICQNAGPFARRCFYHALQREENQLMTAYPIGKEQLLIKSIKTRLASMEIEELEEEPLSESLCARIIAKRFLRTWKKMPRTRFKPQSCGNAPLSVCNDAYRFILKQQLKEGKKPDCSSSISSEEAIDLGFPGWDQALDDSAKNAWQSTCDQMHGMNHKPPDFIESQAN